MPCVIVAVCMMDSQDTHFTVCRSFDFKLKDMKGATQISVRKEDHTISDSWWLPKLLQNRKSHSFFNPSSFPTLPLLYMYSMNAATFKLLAFSTSLKTSHKRTNFSAIILFIINLHFSVVQFV